MWILAAFALFGMHLAYTVKDRLGASFLGFAITTLMNVVIEAAPHHINGSPYGRRIIRVIRDLAQGHTDSLPWMLAATAAGVLTVWFFAALSEDRKERDWDPDRPRRKGRRRAPAAA
jgi:hypothetical protein